MLFFVLAAALTCGNLCHPHSIAYYSDLLAEGGSGRLPIERGGFLSREPDGTLTFAPWPRGEHQRATFRGTIPRGTIAVVHTHPRHLQDPSGRDVTEAKRLRLPVVVVTPRAISVARPDGSIGQLLGEDWSAIR